jgi:hypothetical protein
VIKHAEAEVRLYDRLFIDEAPQYLKKKILWNCKNSNQE